MAVVSMKALLESGVHFGHRTNKWHPAMRPYIFTERNGIHIIDLQQTVKSLNTAFNLVRDTVQNGGVVLFIGTKRQAQETIKEEAIRCGMPYVTERWLGGMLTNWVTIFQRINELERLERMRDDGDLTRLTKKEGLMIEREIKRLEIRLGGVRAMKLLPNLVFVVDVSREYTAVHEANLVGIPVLALVDTNCDPSSVDYVIPSNDDAIRAIKLLVGKIADAVLEGKAMRKDDILAEEAAAALPPTSPLRSRYAEDELDEGDLLGDATLAKLGGAPRVAEEEIEEEAVAEEAAEVPVSPEAEPDTTVDQN
jgi:small subunit ribosomal protein S2